MVLLDRDGGRPRIRVLGEEDVADPVLFDRLLA